LSVAKGAISMTGWVSNEFEFHTRSEGAKFFIKKAT
jgi:hypothetical protein